MSGFEDKSIFNLLVVTLVAVEMKLVDMVFNLAPLPDFTSVRAHFLTRLSITEDLMPCYCDPDLMILSDSDVGNLLLKNWPENNSSTTREDS